MSTNQQKTANLYRVFGTDASNNINSLTLANITATGSANLGIIDNVYIGGGANAQILQTDGNGGLSWTNPGGGGGGGIPGGSNTQLQFNNNGQFGGIPTVTYNGTNVSLGAVGTIKITGGTSGQFLQTNGSGDLQWVPGTSSPSGTGTVTSVGAIAGTGIAVSGGPITTFGNITVTNTGVTSLIAGTNITLSGSNGAVTITASGGGGGAGVTQVGGDGSGLGFALSGLVATTGNLTLAVPTDSQLKTTLGINAIGNVANLSLNGNAGQFLNGVGGWSSSSFSGVLSNITYGIENVAIIANQTGTYNFDITTGAIKFATLDSTANVAINFRGNATTTFNSLLSAGQSITASYVMTNGVTGYTVPVVLVDGSTQSINWVNSVVPPSVPNAIMSFVFTIIKTAASAYKVLGSATRYSV